ncbi:hypothetical protein [Salinigranum halophilum]|uniref:hypothetical protein n=1 Tax=Salinigranum halophilum TaxID=2565931 RepID=UPI0010A78C59|nr:hypothetical protein [Salinigranum halophilum]
MHTTCPGRAVGPLPVTDGSGIPTGLRYEAVLAVDHPGPRGYAKIVVGLSVGPYGEERTPVTDETRTAGPDPVAAW